MSVAPDDPDPPILTTPALPPRLVATVVIAAFLVLAAGLLKACAPLTAAAAAVGGGAALPGVALIRRGWAIRVASRSSQSVRGACRCAGMLGLGMFASASMAAVLPLVDPAHRAAVATAGFTLAAGLFMLGLLHIPGFADTAAGRLRRGLDGLIIGTSLGLVGWLLLPGLGAEYPYNYLAATIAASCTAIAMAVALRVDRQRRAALRCTSGTMLAVAGLALLLVTLGQEAPPQLLLLAAALVVAGVPLILAGGGEVPPPGATVLPARLDDFFGGFPVLAVPVGALVLAVLHHLLTAGTVDRTAVLLGTAVGGMLAVREVFNATDLRSYGRRLADQRAHLRALVTGASDVTMLLADDLSVRWQSPAAGRLFGLTDEAVIGRRFTALVHPEDVPQVADWLRVVADSGSAADSQRHPPLAARIRDGLDCWRDTESTVSDLRAVPAVGALVVQLRDIGHRRALERTVHRLTWCDQLTGLPNRRELLRGIAARRDAGGRAGTLLVIDLSGFCAVNDLKGRTAGDTLLMVAAQRLRTVAGPDELVSRLGERQFAVVTANRPIEAYALGCRVLAALSQPYQLPGSVAVQLVPSIGMAALTGSVPAEELLRRGDMALRRAVELRHARIDWYDESLEKHLVRRLDIERHLPGAAGRGELDLVYQPVVELTNGRPVGVEALLRWRHPVLGTVQPHELLPAVDRLRLGSEVGDWTLHTACQQVALWRRRGYDLWLAVNVTVRQLAAAEFVPEVAAALSVHQNPPERLTIELAEAEVVDSVPAVAGQLSKLRALGVRTGLDEVGASHTDLARLRRLPLDVIKLCPSLAGAPPDGSAGELAAAVVDVARRLGATVVAAGLETHQQRQLVLQAGCRLGQGYLVAAPAPAAQLEEYLAGQLAVAG